MQATTDLLAFQKYLDISHESCYVTQRVIVSEPLLPREKFLSLFVEQIITYKKLSGVLLKLSIQLDVYFQALDVTILKV